MSVVALCDKGPRARGVRHAFRPAEATPSLPVGAASHGGLSIHARAILAGAPPTPTYVPYLAALRKLRLEEQQAVIADLLTQRDELLAQVAEMKAQRGIV